MHKHGLPPLIPAHCRLLVLGSLPGNQSLAVQQYYGHPRNQFWALLGAVSGYALPDFSYEARLATLSRLGIGLWDVFASAERVSSLDSDIRAAVSNPLEAALRRLPDCRTVACNGKQAGKAVVAQIGGKDWEIIHLPSSSPAYTAPFETKLARWSLLKPLLTLQAY